MEGFPQRELLALCHQLLAIGSTVHGAPWSWQAAVYGGFTALQLGLLKPRQKPCDVFCSGLVKHVIRSKSCLSVILIKSKSSSLKLIKQCYIWGFLAVKANISKT